MSGKKGLALMGLGAAGLLVFLFAGKASAASKKKPAPRPPSPIPPDGSNAGPTVPTGSGIDVTMPAGGVDITGSGTGDFGSGGASGSVDTSTTPALIPEGSLGPTTVRTAVPEAQPKVIEARAPTVAPEVSMGDLGVGRPVTSYSGAQELIEAFG